MTVADQVKAAQDWCLKNAEETDDIAAAASLRLYADIIPLLIKFEQDQRVNNLSPRDYIHALTNVAATLCVHGARNATQDDPAKKAFVCTKILELFPLIFVSEMNNASLAAVIGRHN